MPLNVNIYTSTYERTHGALPRGKGSWAFILMDRNFECETVFAPANMTLAQAKAWMRDYCIKHHGDNPRGYQDVEVAP